jgi:hypothetical protein
MNSYRRSPLTVHNVALRFNRPERTIRHWAKIGKLQGFKIDKKSWGFAPEYIHLWQVLYAEKTNV